MAVEKSNKYSSAKCIKQALMPVFLFTHTNNDGGQREKIKKKKKGGDTKM